MICSRKLFLIKNHISKANSRKCHILNILYIQGLLSFMIYFTIKSLKDNYLLFKIELELNYLPSMVEGRSVDTISPCPFWFLYKKHWKQQRTAQRNTNGCLSLTMDMRSTTIAGLLHLKRKEQKGALQLKCISQ